MKFPEPFLDQMQRQFAADEYSAFVAALQSPPPVSIRLHPMKCTHSYFQETVPWCPQGRYLAERPVFTLDPAFHAGSYYVQEASSMILWHVLQQLNVTDRRLRVLDLCAAPGGKTTLFADFLGENHLIVANEIHKSRVQILRNNVLKTGYSNILVSNNSPEELGQLSSFFDVILIDAPCSGEGMFRKDAASCDEWSPGAVTLCAARQKDILRDILPALAPGGFLLFSTCTYNTQENEGSMRFLSEVPNLENKKLDFPESFHITKRLAGKAEGYQMYPHLVRGEGFFISAFQKTDAEVAQRIPRKPSSLKNAEKETVRIVSNEWCAAGPLSFIVDKAENIHLLKENLCDDAMQISPFLRLLACGVNAGTLQKNVFLPHHNLALSHWKRHDLSVVRLDKQDALKYLKREALHTESGQKGWHIVQYEGACVQTAIVDPTPRPAPTLHSLGWAKNVGSRFNNYLPSEWRIRMEIDRPTG